jgi:hypothetical protein
MVAKPFRFVDNDGNDVGRYLELRRAQSALNDELVRRLAKPVILDCARRLDLWEDGRIAAEEHEMIALMDFCLYDCYVDGKNAVVRLRAGAGFPAGSDDAVIIGAMVQSPPLSLFRIDETEKDKGVGLRDLLTDERVFVVDQALGQTGWSGAFLATRVLRVEEAGLNMTSGASLGVRQAVAEGVAADVRAELGAGAAGLIAGMSTGERVRLAVRILREVFRDPGE